MEIADEIVVVANGYVRDAGARQVILPALLADEHRSRCPLEKEENLA